MLISREMIFSICFGAVVTINLIGNSLVLAVILKNRYMRTPVNYLLLNLAMVDLLVGISAIPSHIVSPLYLHPQGTEGDYFCKLITSDNLTYICGQVSAFTLTVIAYERFQAVVHPHTVKEKITKTKILGCLIVCWIISIATIGPWIYWAKVNPETGQCYEGEPPSFVGHIYRYINVIIFGGPIVAMTILYGQVIRKLTKSEHQDINRIIRAAAKVRMRRRITWMLLSVALVYVICWSPITVFFVATNEGSENVLYHIFTLLVSLNSGLNAFLYTLFSNQFRQGFKNVFICHFSSENVIGLNSNDRNSEDQGVASGVV